MAGTARTTLKEIKSQVQQSLAYGAQSNIKKAVASSGTSDAALDSIMECLLKLHKDLRNNHGVKSKQQFESAHARQTLEKQLEEILKGDTVEDRINPLLGIPGICFICSIHIAGLKSILHRSQYP